MSGLVKRPLAIRNPGQGLFRNDHFQIAYATNDLDRACGVFRERFGIKEYRRLEGGFPEGGHIRIELAWAGGTMYELIRAEGAGSAFYNVGLSPASFAIRHHHLGYFVYDQEGWDALMKEIEQGGWRVAFRTAAEGFLQACYIEVPELGHYLEYLFPEAAGIEFFEAVPVS